MKKVKLLLLIMCVIGLLISLVGIVNYIKDEKSIEQLQSTEKKVNSENSCEEIHYSDVHLKIEYTEIDYDIMQGEDNTYYLSHTPDGEYNKAGWLYFDYRVTADSRNKIIYGHNRVTGKMFGSLTNLTMLSYYDKYGTDTIHLIEDGVESIYRIFAVYSVNKDFNYLICDFEDNICFKEYVEKVRNLNKIKSLESVEVKEDAEIITLSTCSGLNDRLVVHGVKIREREDK